MRGREEEWKGEEGIATEERRGVLVFHDIMKSTAEGNSRASDAALVDHRHHTCQCIC